MRFSKPRILYISRRIARTRAIPLIIVYLAIFSQIPVHEWGLIIHALYSYVALVIIRVLFIALYPYCTTLVAYWMKFFPANPPHEPLEATIARMRAQRNEITIDKFFDGYFFYDLTGDFAIDLVCIRVERERKRGAGKIGDQAALLAIWASIFDAATDKSTAHKLLREFTDKLASGQLEGLQAQLVLTFISAVTDRHGKLPTPKVPKGPKSTSSKFQNAPSNAPAVVKNDTPPNEIPDVPSNAPGIVQQDEQPNTEAPDHNTAITGKEVSMAKQPDLNVSVDPHSGGDYRE